MENTQSNYCGCDSCTTEVWDRITDQFSCGARISWLLNAEKMPLKDACHLVSGIQFPTQCSPCDPQICRKQAVPPQVNEGGGETATTFPDVSEESSFHVAEPSEVIGTRCGCSECVESIYSTQVDGYSLSDRIDFLLNTDPNLYPTEEGACRRIFQVEFPGFFFSNHCDPDRCGGQQVSSFNPSSHNVDLYCFPPYDERSRFEQVWGKYSVHIKEGLGCGPSNNVFGPRTITLENNGNDLKLQFKRVKDSWEASEVRILLPDNEGPYHYGTYSFSVKSVQVYDSINGSRVGDKLPPSLVLGLFTWDPTEDYVIHENYNHEVDVEISRWNSNDSATPDAQFLVQPPLEPHMYRFFTGPNNNTYYQSSRTYSFDWEPAQVTWQSNAGSGHRFQYSTEDALQSGQVDYTQCMPANVEVRINLWNLFGDSKPAELEDSHVVEVVIDNFQYIPSGKTHVPDGGTCSKDCHCSPTSMCIYNQCMERQWRRVLSGASTSGATKIIVGEDKAASFGLEASLLVLAGCAIAAGLLTLLHPATKQICDTIASYR